MSEFDCGWVEDEICATCKWFDEEYSVCKNSSGIKAFIDDGKEDWCVEWTSKFE